MGLDDAEKEVDKGEYKDAVKDIEKEIDTIEEDFETVKDDNASGDLKEKQEKAEDILSEIHDQMKFLQEQVERIDQDEEEKETSVQDIRDKRKG